VSSQPGGRNRERILAAAPGVLNRTGIAGFGLPEVAKSAGVSRQTIYNHFSGREELLAELLVQEMLERHAPIHAKFSRRKPSVKNFIELLLMEMGAGREYALYEDMLSPHTAPRIAEIVFGSAAVTAAREAAWLPVLERYERHGLLRPGLDHHEVVRWITYQQFWFLTNPNTMCGTDWKSLAHVFGTFVTPALFVELAPGPPSGRNRSSTPIQST
jgi:AcrR family transcriptional regulator